MATKLIPDKKLWDKIDVEKFEDRKEFWCPAVTGRSEGQSCAYKPR